MIRRWQWFVPGRLEVFGKHTDYAGGRSLVAAVPRGITVSATAADDGHVAMDDVTTGEEAVFRIGDAVQPGGWRRYPAAAIRRLHQNFPGANLSARIEITSNLPRAAGISSSSALVIAVVESLIARADLEERPEWKDAIRSVEDRVSYLGCIENGSSFGPLAGDTGVGTHGGSEDHAAILMGKAGALQQFSFAPLHLEGRVMMPAGWTFAIASTGVRARKTGEARESYNRAAAMAGDVLAAWRLAHPGDDRSLGALVRAGESFDALSLPAELRARLEHFVAEDARVPDAAAAFARGDVGAVGALAAASQRDAERLLRNQVPETTELVALALQSGASAASGFGAGWGGSVWALIREAEASGFLARWLSSYRASRPHLSPEAFLAPPSAGLRRL